MALFRCCNLSRFVKFSKAILQHATANSHNYLNPSSHFSAWFASTEKKLFSLAFHFCSCGLYRLLGIQFVPQSRPPVDDIGVSHCILGYRNPWLALSNAHPLSKRMKCMLGEKDFCVFSPHSDMSLLFISHSVGCVSLAVILSPLRAKSTLILLINMLRWSLFNTYIWLDVLFTIKHSNIGYISLNCWSY